MKFYPFLFEFFEADIAEALPEFAGYGYVSLCFAEPSVADGVCFSYLPCVLVTAAGLRFVS